MNFLKEILSTSRYYEDQEDDLEDLPPEDDDQDLEDLPPEEDDQLDDLPLSDQDDIEDLPRDDSVEDLPDDQDDGFEGDGADDKELDEIANNASEDPDKQGVIRAIRGAHLVYKRKQPDGTYEELWLYNSGSSMKDELKIRHAIVADTDIPIGKQTSPDGKTSFSSWTAGNAEMLKLVGLQN